MQRAFMRFPPWILTNAMKEYPPSSNAYSTILQLPTEILNVIFDDLDVLDRCMLALCCKRFCLLAQTQEHLDYILTKPPSAADLQHFFQHQLGRGWIPSELQYCPDCGKFVSTAQSHWRVVSEKHSRELSGRISQLWRTRREDGWLRYWIERWCLSGYHCDDRTTRVLIREDHTMLVCPRCAMQNPECNAWREHKSQKRTVRPPV